MKPAEVVTAVVSVPVVAAFLVSVFAAPVAPETPAAITVEAPHAAVHYVADEIVVVAKRVAAAPTG